MEQIDIQYLSRSKSMPGFKKWMYEVNSTNQKRALQKKLSLSSKKQLEKLEEIYQDSFTVHGLTRVFKGNKVERYIWGMFLFLGCALIAYVVSGFLNKFSSKEVYTNMKTISTQKNNFHAVTICIKRGKHNTYCHRSIVSFGRPRYSLSDDQCQKNFSLSNHTLKGFTDLSARNANWNNGKFYLECTASMEGCDAILRYHMITSEYSNNKCITINPLANYSNPQNELSFRIKAIDDNEFKNNADKSVDFNVHSSGEKGAINPTILKLSWGNGYNFLLHKTVMKRLPTPYPSDCRKEMKGISFPGNYSSTLCYHSFKCINALKMCGDTYDFCQPFLPKYLKDKYQKKRAVKEVYGCLQNHSNIITDNSKSKAKCPVACNENMFTLSATSFKLVKTSRLRVHIKYQHSNVYNFIEEKELYTWDNLLSDMGGFIGLIIGASLFSMIEIITYITIKIMKRLNL